jgi:hypothetical protein
MATPRHAQAGDIGCAEIYAGPTFAQSPAWDGYIIPTVPGFRSVTDGVGVAYASRYDGGLSRGTRSLRLTPSGWVEMGDLGLRNGTTYCYVQAINPVEWATGWANYYVAGSNRGPRAVRWDADGVATRLNDIGTDSFGNTATRGRDINLAGTVVGSANRYVNGQQVGMRAVRWNAGSILATTLNPLNLDATGSTYSAAYAIHDAGVVVGYAQRWGSTVPGGGDDDDGGGPGYTINLGQRAIRWAPDSVIAVELGHLGRDAQGYTNANALAINSYGTAIGWANKYSDNGVVDLGRRAVRWGLKSTEAFELEPLATNQTGYALNDAWAINDSGTVVGQSQLYDAVGAFAGSRPVRWDAESGEVFALGLLGTDAQGVADGAAQAVNSAGLIVGRARAYDESGTMLGWRAVLWDADDVAIDLTDYVDVDTGWVSLDSAVGISDDNWITGVGSFDPDGPGGLAPYPRMFLLAPAFPAFASHPASSTACTGAELSLEVTANGYEPFAYRWQIRDGAAPTGWRTLSDGEILIESVPCGHVAGSTSQSLTIQFQCAPAVPPQFRCVIDDECVSVAGVPATLSVAEAVLDIDGDCATGEAEKLALPGCVYGPNAAPSVYCMPFDLDGDHDVDLADIARFQPLYLAD